MNIVVPRTNVSNKGVCSEVESLLLDIIAKDAEEAWHVKELTKMVARKLGRKYGELQYHVVRALDQFFANRLIKRVAPSVFQSADGPDDEYSERASGHVPEGQPYASRPGNYTDNPTVPSARKRANFNADVRKVQVSVNMLKSPTRALDEIQRMLLDSGNFNPVAVRYCIRQNQPDTFIARA